MSPSASKLSSRLLAFILLLGASFIAFQPAINAGFSDYDDVGFIKEPTFWRGLSPAHLVAIFTTPWGGHYQPLTYVTYAIEGTLFGLKPHVFHLTNILIHGLNACLLWRLAVRLLRSSISADLRTIEFITFAFTLLWAVHPLRVETVAWITERRDVLAAFFLLLATRAYVDAVDGTTTRVPLARLATTLLFLTLSLFSKAWGITFVAVALLLDVVPLRRLPWNPREWGGRAARSILIEKLPMAALSVIFGIVAQIAIRAVPEAAPRTSQWGLIDRFCQMCYGLFFYIRKSLVPLPHSALIELPQSASPAEPRFLIAILVVFVAVATCVWLVWKRPRVGVPLTVVLLLYAALISPVIGLTQAGIQLVAERYAYLSTIPLMIGLAALVVKLKPGAQSAAAVAALVGALIGTALSHQQSDTWKDSRLLWEQALANGFDGPVLRNYYGRQLEKKKEYAKAEEQYLKSLAFNERYGDTWHGLGTSRLAQGKRGPAKEALIKAVELLPNPLQAHYALGLIAREEGDGAEAIRQFQATVDILERDNNPSQTGMPYLWLASAYGEVDDLVNAKKWLLKAREFSDARPQAEELLLEVQHIP